MAQELEILDALDQVVLHVEVSDARAQVFGKIDDFADALAVQVDVGESEKVGGDRFGLVLLVGLKVDPDRKKPKRKFKFSF